MLLKAQALVSLFTCTCMFGATLPSGSIGTVTTSGEVQVDGSTIRSNSTLFDGSVVQTSGSRSDLRLSDGSQVVLNPSSRMTLYRDHVVLTQGETMQRSGGKHAVVANGLKVSAETSNGVMLVGVQDPTHMQVAARDGAVDVRTSAGNLIARVQPGRTLSFDTTPRESMSPSEVQISGVVRTIGGNYMLTDTQSGLSFQLRGGNLAELSGKPVQVIGMLASAAPTAVGVAPVVNVSRAVPQNQDSTQANDGGKASSEAVAPASTPLFNKSSDLFLVAVAAVGVLGGLAAAGAFSGGHHHGHPPTPSIP